MSRPAIRITVARKVRAPFADAWVRKVVQAGFRAGGHRGAGEAAVVLVGDAEMRRLNRRFRGKRRTTDVLSFPLISKWPSMMKQRPALGDIVLSLPQTRKQAAEGGKSLRSEAALLLVHGALHLLGYDHETLKDEKRMFGLQDRALKRLHL